MLDTDEGDADMYMNIVKDYDPRDYNSSLPTLTKSSRKATRKLQADVLRLRHQWLKNHCK